MKRFTMLALILAAALAGCHRGGTAEQIHQHKDVPPHGGTPVALSDDYNLELVRDASTGTLFAYVLDDEMEEFMRSSSPSITIRAKAGGVEHVLRLSAVANAATGETVGDTAEFEGSADWLKTAPAFDGTLDSIAVRGSRFHDIPFNFPKGNEGD